MTAELTSGLEEVARARLDKEGGEVMMMVMMAMMMMLLLIIRLEGGRGRVSCLILI